MRFPSKRVYAIAQANQERKIAIQSNDPEAFAAAVAKIREHEASEDVLTCACCAEDFPATDEHVEILAAAVIVYPKTGEAEIERYDYGINDVARGEAPGRRFKFCGKCAAEWKIHARDYVEMR